MNIKVLSLLLGLVITLPLGASEASTQDYALQGELVRFVMLSRHGVRSPLQKPDELNKWRRSPEPKWPDFGVCPGYLTNPHGANLIKLMGAYYRKYLNDEKLFTPGQCPKDDVFIWTDVDQRTRATAEALVVGLADGSPQCSGFSIKGDPNPHKEDPGDCKKAAEDPDPLFHPTQAEKNLPKCFLDPTKVDLSVGTLDDLKRTLKPRLAKTQDILKCCSNDLCEREHPPRRTCELPELRSWLEPNLTDNADPQHVSASLKGGLGIAQTFAEILMLEYAHGFTGQRFGFGRPEATEANMLDILQIHTEVFKKVQRACYVAQQQGDNLLYHLTYAVQNGRDPTEPDGDKKFIAYIGHDTNIANVAGLLDLHWRLSEYPVDDMPPGGALIFEVRKALDKQLYVYAFFAAESPDTMRQGDKAVAEMRPVSIPCTGKGNDGSCSIAEFIKLTDKALDNKAKEVCVTDLR
ncbi:MAG: histidine-type phosphatase [Methylocella sp.]